MDAENAPYVLAVCTRLLSEAGRDASPLEGQRLGFDPFVAVHRRDGLFRGGDQIVAVVLVRALHLVQVLFEVGQLASLFHNRLLHEEWRLQGHVSLLDEALKSVVDEGLVEEDTCTLEEVASVASDLLSALEFNNVKDLHDFMMM